MVTSNKEPAKQCHALMTPPVCGDTSRLICERLEAALAGDRFMLGKSWVSEAVERRAGNLEMWIVIESRGWGQAKLGRRSRFRGWLDSGPRCRSPLGSGC